MTGSILFLDLATQMGWAEGVPGEKPTFGTVRLAPVGSSPAAIFGGMIDWLGTRLQALRYRRIVYEAPLDPRWMKQPRSAETARVLLGLPAVVEGVAYQMGYYGPSLAEANVQDVRKHLLGIKPQKGDGKRLVMQRLRALGYEPQDDNAGGALAGWLYASALADSRIAQMTSELFATSKK